MSLAGPSQLVYMASYNGQSFFVVSESISHIDLQHSKDTSGDLDSLRETLQVFDLLA